jgi:hypothetical protein
LQFDHDSNIIRKKDILSGDIESLASQAAENLNSVRGGNGPMMGLVGALVFGMYIL